MPQRAVIANRKADSERVESGFASGPAVVQQAVNNIMGNTSRLTPAWPLHGRVSVRQHA
jgi:hypothetical protein